MDSVPPLTELERQLKESGEQLTSPPPSVTHLLDLLDKTKKLLTMVNQGPSVSMQGALVPPMGALISDELLKHPEIDVKISVALCLCEVARITAPDAPYKDETMKEIFKLNLLAFEQLSNVTSQSYRKVIHVLESVAKFKSCLLMLDLECDALVLQMFKQFLSKIRLNHPQTVFSAIETIMTLIIDESDEIASELLYLLLSHVKKENKIVSPASWKLAEKVLRNCSDTLKPYHETIMEIIDSNLDDYAEVVTLLCQVSLENEHVVTRSTRTNRAHKRDLLTMENGGSAKKQKYIDKHQFKGKGLETSKRGRPKKNKNNSPDDIRKTRSQEKRQSSKTKGNIKNSGSSYDGSIGKDIPKKWGKDLVGHGVKVWWPLDETYYKGVVASYDPVEGKHKILYADGDEEVLDLHQEKWKMLDEIPANQQQERVADMPSPTTTTAKPKEKGERNIDTSPTQDNSNSPKSSPPPDSSPKEVIICLATDGICNVDDQKDNLVPTPDVSCGPKLTEKTVDVSCEPKPTEKTVDGVEENAELHPSGEAQESQELQGKSLLDSKEETPQRLEKTESLVSETQG